MPRRLSIGETSPFHQLPKSSQLVQTPDFVNREMWSELPFEISILEMILLKTLSRGLGGQPDIRETALE